MRRLVVFLGIALIALGAGFWWYYLRPTPEKVLDRAFTNFVQAKSIGAVSGSAFWDTRDPSGRGFVLDRWISYSGSLDLNDMTRPRMSGIIGVSKQASGEDFQTADAVLTDSMFAFKGREVGASFQEWIDEIAASSTAGSWVSVDRDLMLSKYGFSKWISIGKGKDLRAVQEEVDARGWAMSLTESLKARDEGDRAVYDINFRFSEPSLESVFVSFLAAWKLGAPDGNELLLLKRAAAGASLGEWFATIDAKTNAFQRIQGRFQLLDSDMKEIGHVNVDVKFDGWNRSISVKAPEQSIDVSANLRGPERRSFTPSSEREVPAPEPAPEPDAATGTEDMTNESAS